MKQFNFTHIFSAAILAGLFMTTNASAQQKEYTDGVFMLNEGSFGNERATVNFLDHNGNWDYRLPITMNGETIQLGTTGYLRREHVYRKQEDGNQQARQQRPYTRGLRR